jgi:hypothetical protein
VYVLAAPVPVAVEADVGGIGVFPPVGEEVDVPYPPVGAAVEEPYPVAQLGITETVVFPPQLGIPVPVELYGPLGLELFVDGGPGGGAKQTEESFAGKGVVEPNPEPDWG